MQRDVITGAEIRHRLGCEWGFESPEICAVSVPPPCPRCALALRIPAAAVLVTVETLAAALRELRLMSGIQTTPEEEIGDAGFLVDELVGKHSNAA